jgi:hypothetical protein
MDTQWGSRLFYKNLISTNSQDIYNYSRSIYFYEDIQNKPNSKLMYSCRPALAYFKTYVYMSIVVCISQKWKKCCFLVVSQHFIGKKDYNTFFVISAIKNYMFHNLSLIIVDWHTIRSYTYNKKSYLKAHVRQLDPMTSRPLWLLRLLLDPMAFRPLRILRWLPEPWLLDPLGNPTLWLSTS